MCTPAWESDVQRCAQVLCKRNLGLRWQIADHGTFSPVVKAGGGNRKALRLAAAGAAIVLALTVVACLFSRVRGAASVREFTQPVT